MNKVLVIGHSFVRRADKHYQLGLEGIKPNLGLIDAVITFRGWSGLTAQKLEDKSCVVDNLDPDILVIDIGSNDLANGADPVMLARRVNILARAWLINTSIQVVICMEVLPKSQSAVYPAPQDFNDRAEDFNVHLIDLAHSFTDPVIVAPSNVSRGIFTYIDIPTGSI